MTLNLLKNAMQSGQYREAVSGPLTQMNARNVVFVEETKNYTASNNAVTVIAEKRFCSFKTLKSKRL